MENETSSMLVKNREAPGENLGLIKQKEELERRLAFFPHSPKKPRAKHAQAGGGKAGSSGGGDCSVNVDGTVKVGTSLSHVKVPKERELSETRVPRVHRQEADAGGQFDVFVAWINVSEAGYIDWPPVPQGPTLRDGARGEALQGHRAKSQPQL